MPKTKKERKFRKQRKASEIIGMTVVTIMILIVFFSPFYHEKASKYTEDEHFKRVSERIQKRYIDGSEKIYPYDKINKNKYYPKVKATDFSIYPLYNENDELKFFLIEFRPFGWLYVSIVDEQPRIYNLLFTRTGMYTLSSTDGESPWTPFTIDADDDTNYIWQVDKNGKKVKYIHSPYNIRGIQDDKRYLVYQEVTKDGDAIGEFIPAVKVEGGKYLNLISNSTFEIENGVVSEKQPYEYISFHIGLIYDLK